MDSGLRLALILYVATCISILTNIIVFRQVISFVFLSFVPGYLLLRILRLGEVGFFERILFSVSLSVALVMFLGLLTNQIGPILGFPEPLSILPLMAITSILTLVLFVVCQRHTVGATHTDKNIVLNWSIALQTVFLSSLLVLSIVGAVYHNTAMLLVMILGIAISWVASVFSSRLIPTKMFPLALTIIAAALLFHTVLISKYYIGVDIFAEFYVFKLTDFAGFWHAPGPIMSYSLIDSLNSMLSITVLPKVYTVILGVDGELFFKLFYPLLFTLVPLTLYKMYERQIDRKAALVSALCFVSTSITFFGPEPLSLSRQMLGQVFFVLAMFIVVEKQLPIWSKRFLLVVFTSALVVSHYSLAFIFVFMIIAIYAFPRIMSIFRTSRFLGTNGQVLTLGMVLLLIALTFSWYIYVSDSPLNQLSNSAHRIVSMFTSDFSRLESRWGQGAFSSLSPTVASSLVGTVHKVLIYLEQAFIVIGVAVLLFRPRAFELSPQFRLSALLGALILGLCFIVPNFSGTLNLSRFYAIVIPLLAPFFVLGVRFLLNTFVRILGRHLPRRIRSSLPKAGVYVAACILICVFLFQVGFVNHIANDYPYSYSLDLDRKFNSKDLGVQITSHSVSFVDTDVFGARWLRERMNSTLQVYADENSRTSVLKSYALLNDQETLPITNGTLEPRAYVYLKFVNVRLGSFDAFNSSEMTPVLEQCNMIYSNGNSETYFVHS